MISRFSNITQSNINTLPKRQQNRNNNSNPNFKGAVELGTQVLNFLNTSPAIGACFVDFFSMVMPRTIVDFGRSKDAGLETGFRESSGTANHAMAGIVGLGAGYAVSSAFNKANGVKAHLMFMDERAIDTFGDFIKASQEGNTGYNARKYWESFFRSIKGFNTTESGNVWKSIDSSVRDNNGKTLLDKAVDIMTENESKKYKVSKNTMAKVIELITGETGAGSTFKIENLIENGNVVKTYDKPIEGSLENLINNAHSMRRAVVDKAAHDKKAIVEDLSKFLKGVKDKKVATVAAGLAVPVAIGMSAQPLNRYLTKKRTGSDGFVGVEGREADHSTKFKIAKVILGLAMGSAMIATILEHPSHLYTKFKSAGKEILSKLQYKGMVPTLDQFKFIYGMTIMSRIFAVRDKNEMRESAIKDSLGFANWLILGGFVSKFASKAFNKGLINYDEAKYGKGAMSFISKAVEKTHEEILYPALKKMGINIIDDAGKVIPFRKLMKLMKEKAAANTEFKALAEETSKRLKYKNYAQLLGYIYSGVVLGVGIPKLNIAITKHCEKKNAQKKAIDSLNNKIKLNNEFSAMQQKDNKTFGAFLSQM